MEIESCSGGGGRVDLGILGVTDEVWPSDNTDPFDRLTIQDGFTTRRSFLAAPLPQPPGLLCRRPLEKRGLAGLTIMDAAKLLRSRSASPVDPTRTCLKRMKTTITSCMRSSQFFEKESLLPADLWADSL